MRGSPIKFRRCAVDAVLMRSTRPYQAPVARLVASALAPSRSAHDRQRELVRASLIARPVSGRAGRWRSA
jgi:hypothetical protein